MPRGKQNGVALGVLGMLLFLVVVVAFSRFGTREHLTAAETAEVASLKKDLAYFTSLGLNPGNNEAAKKADARLKQLQSTPVAASSGSNSAEIATLQKELADLAKFGLNPSNNEAAKKFDIRLRALQGNSAPTFTPAAPTPMATAPTPQAAQIAKLQKDMADLTKFGLNPSNNEAARKVDAELKMLQGTSAPTPMATTFTGTPISTTPAVAPASSQSAQIAKLQKDMADLTKFGLNPSNNEAARKVDAELKMLQGSSAPTPMPAAPTPISTAFGAPVMPPTPVMPPALTSPTVSPSTSTTAELALIKTREFVEYLKTIGAIKF